MLIGIDCDLHEVTWWVSEEHHAQGRPNTALPALYQFLRDREPATLLYEIAGPVDYTDNKGAAHNKRRWTIFNVATAVEMDYAFATGSHRFLVSPSNLWTRGYPEAQRHMICGCTAGTHDLREAQAMTKMYARHPEAWKSLSHFLAAL